MAMDDFDFSLPFGDARIEELKVLSSAVKCGKIELTSSSAIDGPWRDLLFSLVYHGLLTKYTPDGRPEFSNFGAGNSGIPGESLLERTITITKVQALENLHKKKALVLFPTHEGRVRLSELKQALRTGREREPFGILWDVRHWERDVQIAILDAGKESPLGLAYLDMNGLKQINAMYGHDGGDLALKAYFQAIASSLGDGGQAYRLGVGADEVLVMLPNCDKVAAVKFVRLACNKLMNERLWPQDKNALLSIAAGVITSIDPNASPAILRDAADKVQMKAKDRSRQSEPRPSVIAIMGNDDLEIIQHGPAGFPVSIVGGFSLDRNNVQAIVFTILNTGKEPLLPFKIGFYHPNIGTFYYFPPEKTGEFFPSQERKYWCPVIMNGCVTEGIPKSLPDDSDFEFRLVLEDSEKVLYSNKRIGRGIAALIKRAVKTGNLGSAPSNEWIELHNSLPDE